jgi:hypothetical protein
LKNAIDSSTGQMGKKGEKGAPATQNLAQGGRMHATNFPVGDTFNHNERPSLSVFFASVQMPVGHGRDKFHAVHRLALHIELEFLRAVKNKEMRWRLGK